MNRIGQSILVTLAIIVALVGCVTSDSSDQTEETMDKNYEAGVFPDCAELWGSINNDPVSADDTAYKLSDLNDYFGENFDSMANNPDNKCYLLKEVNQVFPIKFFRSVTSEGRPDGYEYVVFPVQEGGLYMLSLYIVYLTEEQAELAVSDCTYINPTAYSDTTVFANIIPGESSYQDVLDVAPISKIGLLWSSGVYSYSLLNPDMVAQISYTYDLDAAGYKDYIVERITFESREECSWVFEWILESDLCIEEIDKIE